MEVSGIIFIGFFCFITSFREVFVSSLLQSLDPFVALLVTFLVVALFFFIVQLNNFKSFCRKCVSSSKTIALLNLSTLIGWFGFYFAVQNLEPAISCSVTFALGPILTMLLEPLFHARRTRDAFEIRLSLVLLSCAVYFFWVSATGRSSLGNMSIQAIIIGFCAAFLSGAATVVNTMSSRRLGQEGLSTFEIMACRFHVLLAVTAIIVFKNSDPSWAQAPVKLSDIAIMAATVIIPLICVQKAIVRLPPYLISLAFTSIPLITICLESLDQRLNITVYTAAGIIVGFLASAAAILRFLIPQTSVKRA